MGLTVSRKSVEKPAAGCKIDKFEPLAIAKINFKNLSLLQCVILCYSGLAVGQKCVSRKKFLSVGPQF